MPVRPQRLKDGIVVPEQWSAAPFRLVGSPKLLLRDTIPVALGSPASSPPVEPPHVLGSSYGLVLRNAMWLVGAQALVMPLSMVINALMARRLGPTDFGYFYLAGTFTSLAFIFVAWGHGGTLPAHVARDRSRAGEFLGSALAWRAATAPVAFCAMVAVFHALAYPARLQLVLALVALNAAISHLTGACQEAVRGFERTDIAAISYVSHQLLTVLLIAPVLYFDGRLPAVLLVFVVASICVLLFVGRSLPGVGVGRLSVRKDTVRLLLAEGWPFLLFGITTVLQPSVDAVFLSKLAPTEVVGWYAAAQKVVGVLVFPAAALVGALYPTLCRLGADDPQGFRDTARRVLGTSLIIMVPLALGCGLYADTVVRIFSRETFGPAADNLRLLAPFVVLVYFSMPLGVTLLAAGRQKAWAAVQLASILVSVVLNPLLIPIFQQHFRNGGMGVCVATLVSESLMVTAGIWMAPRGVFDRSFARSLLRVGAAGLAMAGVARLLLPLTPFAAAPAAVLAYFACLWAVGGLDEDQLAALKAIVARRAARS